MRNRFVHLIFGLFLYKLKILPGFSQHARSRTFNVLSHLNKLKVSNIDEEMVAEGREAKLHLFCFSSFVLPVFILAMP